MKSKSRISRRGKQKIRWTQGRGIRSLPLSRLRHASPSASAQGSCKRRIYLACCKQNQNHKPKPPFQRFPRDVLPDNPRHASSNPIPTLPHRSPPLFVLTRIFPVSFFCSSFALLPSPPWPLASPLLARVGSQGTFSHDLNVSPLPPSRSLWPLKSSESQWRINATHHQSNQSPSQPPDNPQLTPPANHSSPLLFLELGPVLSAAVTTLVLRIATTATLFAAFPLARTGT